MCYHKESFFYRFAYHHIYNRKRMYVLFQLGERGVKRFLSRHHARIRIIGFLILESLVMYFVVLETLHNKFVKVPGVQLAEILGIVVTKLVQILCYTVYHGLIFVDTFSTQQIWAETVIRKKIQSPPFCYE